MVFSNCCNITDRVYTEGRRWGGGGGVGVGGGWEAEGGPYHPQGDTRQQCVLSRAQNSHSQPGRPPETVVGSSLTHHVALLVPLSGSIDPVVDRRGFTGSAKYRL